MTLSFFLVKNFFIREQFYAREHKSYLLYLSLPAGIPKPIATVVPSLKMRDTDSPIHRGFMGVLSRRDV